MQYQNASHPQYHGSQPPAPPQLQSFHYPTPAYGHSAQPAPPFDLHATIGDKLDDVISLMDQGEFSGNERELSIVLPDPPVPEYSEPRSSDRDVKRAGIYSNEKRQKANNKRSQGQGKQVNVFDKLQYYMNSRLPPSLPPLRVYMPTYPLLCLAAQYSASAYYNPQSPSERKDFVSADGRLGTKAMVIKSVPCDDKKTIVFAIRGTSMLSIRDWGVNLQTGPVSAQGFLDDEGNLCHSGFLKVAKAMVKPIASRLRTLLEENPNRTSCSLLITGHSAGGAVASLLYAHMLSESIQSELNILTGCFKRVHCITFGAPPVTLLPLQKPETADGRLKKCLFHGFINEGDPVVRAERAYVKSLVDLLSQPAPPSDSLLLKTPRPSKPLKPSTSALNLLSASVSRLDLSLNPTKKKPTQKHSRSDLHPPGQSASNKLWWDIPPATLSNAGRLVVLRIPAGGRTTDVTASIVRDDQLRQVIFGDPLVHSMDVYAARIEALAVRAVTGRGGQC
ncbi:uncharacterized protein A1O9_04804 [Exophiala aquamarina CBS 119918]|uniref:Fungal lipase-type domain-containing protein n=1 Tax=Exophiala aquamarina CBS 119918 TaxID=1182545 RepID=A0A072PJ90_9EURO|nr:uncharacterized protein A1O9_04804 [Exophiala aquamarina CBS 119918]KEF59956.1 hypothetical protein A1O9_04804 [Exophiala aquamarina CBS 119918]